MKKLSVFVTLLLIVTMLAIPALAAQTATITVTSSANSAYRGDTITVTVSTSKIDTCTSGGFMFTYDKNVFEYVSGSAVLSGYTSGVSTQAGNVAGYFMNGNATVQGNLFQITLKVKDTAAFGTYTISGTPNLSASDGAVTCNTNGATITVACRHSYSNWSDAGNGKHSKTCSICQDVQTVNHAWDNGAVTKAANCKETGVKTYTCTGCNATKTEDVAKTNDHKYGNWTDLGNGNHKHICSVCQKEETAGHGWNGGVVTKAANCKETGVKTYTCTACNATKTEDVAKTNDHKYGNWTKVNDTMHKHTCSVCSKEETANHSWNGGSVTKKATCQEAGIKTYTCTACSATKTETITKLTTHTYDHACDTDCNVCGVTRTTTHNYKASWSKDKTNHWHECSACKDKKDTAAHTPGAEATETTAQTCTECGYVIKAALGHTHNYADSWTSDESGHWHICFGCEEKGSFASHTPGPDATATTDQVCTACGYVLKEATGETEPTTPSTEPSVTEATQPESTPVAPTEPAGNDKPQNDSSVWIIVVVAVAVLGGGAATGVIIWKKKH